MSGIAHFADGLIPQECSYGANCPLDRHFDSVEAAQAKYDELLAVLDQEFDYSIPGISYDDLERTLSVLGASSRYQINAEGFQGEKSEEEFNAFLETLLDAGLLSCTIESLVQVHVDGTRESIAPQIRWKFRDSSFNWPIWLVDNTLVLSDLGEKTLEAIKNYENLHCDVRSEIDGLKDGGAKIREFEDRLKLIRDAAQGLAAGTIVLPKMTARLREQAELLFAASDDVLTIEKIADTIGSSKQTATTVARKLALLELCTKIYTRDHWRRTPQISYELHRTAVGALGSLDAVLGARI